MDAIACAAPPALLSRSFADTAIARALSFSVSGCSSDPDHSIFACSTVTTPAPALICEPAAALPPSTRCRQQLGPAGGRAGKRRPRPSKRAPTTYISTDAATFCLMVQQVTGADAETLEISQDVGAGAGLQMPSFDVGPLLPSSDPAAAYVLPPAAPAAADQPCFPTLDSWNVMYGKNEGI